jgi:hypothetical protein
MSCELCSSARQAEFTTETMIHFKDFNHLAHPGVLTFPTVLVCLDCGFSCFKIPESELRLLREVNARSAAA